MTTFRENLLDRMIKIYGFEHPIALQFATLCEDADSATDDQMLEILVRAHEDDPQIFSVD